MPKPPLTSSVDRPDSSYMYVVLTPEVTSIVSQDQYNTGLRVILAKGKAKRKLRIKACCVSLAVVASVQRPSLSGKLELANNSQTIL